MDALPQGPVVYLLRCRDGTLYTGWTTDLRRRLRAHRAGKGARYTRSRLPVELVLAIQQTDASSARREEARIRRLPPKVKLTLGAAAHAPHHALGHRPGIGKEAEPPGSTC